DGGVALGFVPEYIATTENFEVTEDVISFYYNPYDIGCYALGGVVVHISREEMQGLCQDVGVRLSGGSRR
ncbi:RsiV family protein, partial [Alistipes putredinis]|uniref:RsiV family protein n=1 Tax=Alistipes putredinis TaxID=28117 RepID=UPI00210B9B4B